MARDGRGNPGRIVLKNQPKLTLAALLRRRKTTLKNFVTELGFTTLTALEIWCKRTGVVPPSQAEFEAAFPPSKKVNSAREGVVVLEAPLLVQESTGLPLEDEPQLRNALVDLSAPPEGTQKKARAKKDDVPTKD